jgi:thermostable 8-oxoguanine DNA glycosylase
MFGLFKKKTKLEKLQLKYEALMKEAYKLSRINRTQSDQKYLEAEEVLKEIEKQDENKK